MRRCDFGPLAMVQQQRGLTLIEVIMAFSLIIVIAVVTMGIFGHGLRATEAAKHITAAAYIARIQMETIKDTPFANITTLFPDGMTVPITGTSLPSGATWTVTYPGGTNTQTLTILITVSWMEDGQARTVQLTTLVSEP